MIVDSCIIWFHLDCIMQLKKSYYIATNVSSRKSATTFGDLPDCLRKAVLRGSRAALNQRISRVNHILAKVSQKWDIYVKPLKL